MTFWLDAHLDPRLAPWLGATFGVAAKTLEELGLRHAEDEPIFEAGRRLAPVVIMTKDYDFVEMVQRRGSPPQVLWLNFGNMKTPSMQIRLRAAFPDALELLRGGSDLVEID